MKFYSSRSSKLLRFSTFFKSVLWLSYPGEKYLFFIPFRSLKGIFLLEVLSIRLILMEMLCLK